MRSSTLRITTWCLHWHIPSEQTKTRRQGAKSNLSSKFFSDFTEQLYFWSFRNIHFALRGREEECRRNPALQTTAFPKQSAQTRDWTIATGTRRTLQNMHVHWNGSVHWTFALFRQVGNRWHYISEEPPVSVGLLSWIPCFRRLQVVSGMKWCCSLELCQSEVPALIICQTNHHDILRYSA